MIIYNAKPEVFVDEDLAKPIKVFTSTTGEKMYVGSAMIQVPNMGNMEAPFQIEADSIEEAFEKYDDAHAAELARVEKEIKEQESKIVAPKNDIVI